MLKKAENLRIIASSIIVALLFLGLFVFAFTIQPAKAQSGTIYINPDGSITPSNANITTSDNVTYTFTGNNYEPIVVQRSGITIDGRGYTVQGTGAFGSIGMNLTGRSNVTIKNMNIKAFSYGIVLIGSFNDTIFGNNITNNDYGVYLWGAFNDTISRNIFINDGLSVWYSFHNVVVDNLVNGKPLFYLENVSGTEVSSAGQVVLVNCRSIIVNNLNLSDTTIGAELWQTSDTIITNNDITHDYLGVQLSFSSNITVSENNITNDTQFGAVGVYLGWGVSGCTVSGNNVKNNWAGFYLAICHNGSTVSENNITNNDYGVYLWWSSGYNSISENSIANNGVGVWLFSSYHNRFFHNYIIDNTQQVWSVNSTNVWDNGYPSGGNYWSDYRKTYPNATENDSSAIWNTPYFIDANNTDRYPLMGPFHTFNVGTWSGVAYSVDTVSNSTITNLSFNQPAKTLTFNVTGKSGTTGFCRVAIPLSLMSGGWIVTVNGAPPLYLNITTYGNYTYIYFTYHHSTETVQITSISVIPEFQPSMLLPLFMITTLLGAIIFKRKRNAKK